MLTGAVIHAPASISESSWPGPHPEYPSRNDTFPQGPRSSIVRKTSIEPVTRRSSWTTKDIPLGSGPSKMSHPVPGATGPPNRTGRSRIVFASNFTSMRSNNSPKDRMEGRFTTRPSAPSGLWWNKSTTVWRKFGSKSDGVASKKAGARPLNDFFFGIAISCLTIPLNALDCNILVLQFPLFPGNEMTRLVAGACVEHSLFALARVRPVVFDGAMGTEIQRRRPSLADFGGREGPNEVLVLYRPDIILDIHRSYLEAGCDVVETDTFGANAMVLAEYGLEREVFTINREAALLARRASDEYSSRGQPRFVSGSVGPGTHLPSLGQVSFRDLHATFREQVRGLLSGGVDCVQVETCQDPLQARAAVIAASDAMREEGRRVPLFCQVTFERSGRLLLGTDPLGAVVSLATLPGLDVFGINCGTGPDSMVRVLRDLATVCPKPLAVLPNAGLPEVRDGNLVYPLGPDAFASALRDFVRDFAVAFVGGCCGTTPDHIRALREALEDERTRPIRATLPPAASSLFSAVSFDQEPRPLIVGERTNAQGSRTFRERLQEDDIEGMVAIARSQAAEGAHALDVSVAVVGREEAADMARFVTALRGVVDLPLVVDSTDPKTIAASLEAWPGRAIVNSVNLEDGGDRLDEIAFLARRHGAAIVGLCIAEDGMCRTADSKVACAKALVQRLVRVHGFSPQDVFIDPLTFTLGSGDESLRDSASETLSAVRRIKAEIPGVYTWLGVSNVSFGLEPGLRRILNSVFLHHAVEAGLDAAILNAGKVLPLDDIHPEMRKRAQDLIYNRTDGGKDPLEALLEAWNTRRGERPPNQASGEEGPIEARLRARILRGEALGIEADIEEALKHHDPMDLVNNVLLPAMQEVGDRFGRGDMQLPFVLKSAEAMKAAMRCLEVSMARTWEAPRGVLVLATVRGDVHDIGKNLVDILLSNNGFRVVNLGTRQPIHDILEAARREGADAIGLSGLLVQSVAVMRDDLAEMQRRGLTLPVLVGGAALSRRYAEEVLAKEYRGPVVYCKDAFAGLQAMRALVSRRSSGVKAQEPRDVVPRPKGDPTGRVPGAIRPAPIPIAPFFETRVEDPVPVHEVSAFISRVSLFRGQWQYRRGRRTEEEWREYADTKLEPLLKDLLAQYEREGVLRPAAVWGLFPANSDGESLVIFDVSGKHEVARFHLPRLGGRSLADFVRPVAEGVPDVLGVQVVTIGPEVARRETALFEQGRYLDYLHLHGLGVEMVEATAEWTHHRIRQALGIAGEDDPDPQRVVRGAYRGCRFSCGYPACPDMKGQKALVDLLGAERIGVTLTEEFRMVPELSASALVLHHPEARLP